MLNSLRSSKSNVFVWIIILLLIVGLAGFGIGSSGGGQATTPVASVGDHEVTVNDYVQALNGEQQRLAQQFGRPLSLEEMSVFGLDAQVLSQLLDVAAVDGEAARMGISVGDEAVARQLAQTPAFQDAAGQFDETAYRFALERAGLSAREFDDALRESASRDIVQGSVIAGVSVPATATDLAITFIGQRRALEWVRLNETALETPIGDPNDAELAAFHEENAGDYTLPERRKLTFAYITEGTLAGSIEPEEDELRALYDDRAEQYSAPERRILDRVVFPDEAAAELAKSQVDTGALTFLQVAAERNLQPSDIELGEVRREDLDRDAREVIFGSSEIGVFGPIKTALGPALFQVNAVLNATTVSFEEARAELVDELSREFAEAEINEATVDIEDLIAGGITIEELAQDTILELGTMEFSQTSEDGLAADAAFRDEALSADAGEERDLRDLSDGIFVLRVDEILEPELQPVADVESELTEAWRIAETEAQLTELAEALSVRIDGGDPMAAIATDHDLIVQEEAPLGRNDIIEDTPPAFMQALFEADTNTAMLVADEGTVLLGRVGAFEEIDLQSDQAETLRAAIAPEYENGTRSDVFTFFTQGLQEQAGVSVNQSLIAAVQAQLSGQYGGHGGR